MEHPFETLFQDGAAKITIDQPLTLGLDENRMNDLMEVAVDGGGVCYAAAPNYWSQVKRAFWRMVCTDDPEFQEVRKKMVEARNVFDATLLASIIAALSKAVSIEAAILAPFIKLLIVSTAKIGLVVFCESQSAHKKRTRANQSNVYAPRSRQIPKAARAEIQRFL